MHDFVIIQSQATCCYVILIRNTVRAIYRAIIMKNDQITQIQILKCTTSVLVYQYLYRLEKAWSISSVGIIVALILVYTLYMS